MKPFVRIVALLLVMILGRHVYAHAPSNSYLRMTSVDDVLRLDWHIAIRDLVLEIPLDSNGDGKITWGEVKDGRTSIFELATKHLQIKSAGKSVALREADLLIDRHSDGAYAVLKFVIPALSKEFVQIEYSLFFETDAQHRGLLYLPEHTTPVLFTPEMQSLAFDPAAPPTQRTFGPLVVEGVWHIWQGFDHLLFLVTLLLPAMMLGRTADATKDSNLPATLWDVAKIVTAFTVAHSITLAVAALGVVRFPIVIIESLIALSVGIAAGNNLRPFLKGKPWMIGFAFGLLHGFGFANVFADLGIAGASIIKPLLAFNLGVELGQLAVVATVLPIAYFIRLSPQRRLAGFRGASATVAVIAATWTLERLLHFKLLPF